MTGFGYNLGLQNFQPLLTDCQRRWYLAFDGAREESQSEVVWPSAAAALTAAADLPFGG